MKKEVVGLLENVSWKSVWRWSREPVLLVGVVVVALVFGIDVTDRVESVFGVDLPDDTINSLVALAGSLLARSRVSPVK